MATLRTVNTADISQGQKDRAARWEDQHPVIEIEYAVVEFTPALLVPGDSPGWTEDQRKLVSPWFHTEAEVEDWIERYDPEEGTTFQIVQKYLRKVPETTRWFTH